MTRANISSAGRLAAAVVLAFAAAAQAQSVKRTKAEIETLIKDAGATPPDWWDTVNLNHPGTLDLTWPDKPGGGWDNKKNVGQFLWDIIQPNPGRWREGVKLMHHLMSLNKDKAAVIRKCQNELGQLYGECMEDYARGAFWWRKSGNWLGLAICYWRMGNKDMAVAELSKLNTVGPGVVKLWADMGNLPKAVSLADVLTRAGQADAAHLAVGDAYRVAGKTKEALASYEKVLAVPQGKGSRYQKRNLDRAKASIEAIKLFDGLDPAKIADGTYTSDSLGYEAAVHVEVVVAGGKITGCKVTQHREKQFYSSINDTPARIIAKQGVKGVDATSGATITSEAIINATAKALNKGLK